MSRLLLAALAALLVLVTPAGAYAALPAGEVHLGAVWSTTGAGAGVAALQPAGAQLAVDELNASGTLGDARLVLDERDDASSATRAATLFGELLDGGAVALLGPSLTNSALQADKVPQARGVPVLGVSNSGDGVLDIGDFVFRDSLSEHAVQPAAVGVAHQRWHFRRAAIVWASPDAFSRASAGVFRTTLQHMTGVRLVADRSFVSATPGADRVALRAIAATHPDVLFISALSGDTAQVMRAARRMPALRHVPFVSSNGFNTAQGVQEAGHAAEGAISGAAWVADEPTPGNAAFVAAFRARYGRMPDQFAAQAYTGVQLLALAIRRADSTDPRAIRDALAGLRDVDTILGRFSFGPDREPQYAPVVQQVRDGRWVRIA